jgi:hypothetical protein
MPKKQGLDDLGKIAKEAYDAMRGGKKAAKKVTKKVSKAKNDIPDPKFPSKKVYTKKGSMTREYKDYVMRNSKGDY